MLQNLHLRVVMGDLGKTGIQYFSFVDVKSCSPSMCACECMGRLEQAHADDQFKISLKQVLFF